MQSDRLKTTERMHGTDFFFFPLGNDIVLQIARHLGYFLALPFYLFLAVLEFKLRALCLLDRQSTI
jgi:hypothetical protein